MDDISYSILIVDDDVSELNALCAILKSSYTVYLAKSGQTALKMARNNKPDIILLDVVMPDINGFNVLEELRKLDETHHIPVILITSLNSVHDEETGFRLGASDYITKPFHSSIVKARIEAQLNTVKSLREKNNSSFLLKTRQELRTIYFRELIYVDVMGHWLNFHLASGEKVEVYSSLKEYEKILLSDNRFGRCHKSFIVNMDYIAVIEVRDILLKNNERLPLSKNYLELKKRYIEWIESNGNY